MTHEEAEGRLHETVKADYLRVLTDVGDTQFDRFMLTRFVLAVEAVAGELQLRNNLLERQRAEIQEQLVTLSTTASVEGEKA